MAGNVSVWVMGAVVVAVRAPCGHHPARTGLGGAQERQRQSGMYAPPFNSHCGYRALPQAQTTCPAHSFAPLLQDTTGGCTVKGRREVAYATTSPSAPGLLTLGRELAMHRRPHRAADRAPAGACATHPTRPSSTRPCSSLDDTEHCKLPRRRAARCKPLCSQLAANQRPEELLAGI